MAERPLYTLYKNLKAQNYDVPDDYNKFESALTRDGKGGADNRHAIYENLKAQNFDVPSTYERFYSALFEPRSRTSSRAKGGSVPMSAADRARFSAGAAAISASAQQTMNNAGRYNRLKQRKQKHQKDFGRVNLGTHKTPYGGDANNVVKDDFAYNPETGKAGAYVTSDNENVYSLPEAEQSQAQDIAYQNAVDTGEIPSAFDVRDKNGNYDLQENINKNGTYLTEEGAQKQFDKKLEDAYARKKEIEAAIAEDHRLHGNPLLSYGASIGASNGRTAEQSDYSNKLATSLALVKQQIGALEVVKQYPTSSWGEDALKALDNTAFTAKTWDFGLTDFATMGQMERIKTKMDNNIPLSGSDKMLLKSKLGADAAAALEDEKMGNIYRWTKIAGQSLPFMADFFLTGGYGGITKGISRGALKFAAKRGMGKVSAAILKNTGIVAGDVIGSYAMAGTEQALKTGADIMQRHLGNLYQDEKGDYKFGTFDENGNLLHEGGESMGTALYKGLTSAMVENYTEKLFGHNYGIKKGAVNFMKKHGMNASAEFFKNIGKSGWYTNSKKWMEKFGINGFGEEVMEEEIGIPLHALLDGDNKFSDLLDAKQQLDIIGGMAISVGSMYAMGAGSRPVKGIYNRAQYYRFRNKVNVADSDAQNLMGDNWADIKDKIDNATNEQMGGVLADILRQRDTMTKEQINAAVNYGVNLMKMRGYNIAKTAEMNAREITNEPTTPEEQHQADIDNAYSEGHDADDADKHDIQIQQEDQMKTLAAALGISEQQLSAMSDEELESLTGQDDKLDQAIYDYQLSSARYQGVVDDAQDKVDLAAHQAEQRVDMYTDQSRGSVRNATIKASGGLEDYGVYIISGNIATHDDGSIDVSNSDDMILYYDPTTNSVEHADALMFAELGKELPADDVKAQAVADAKENAIKEVAGIIDGTVEVGSQFNVTDTDGTEHTYEVLADYGDGTAAISIDGNVVENPYSLADLQQMKDLEDQKRLEAAKAEREQMEKERAAQQNQETEESQPSFDFNQILNDNGNVVLVDVLDKDGNTKYPDSRLFLIRDAGAKAKVVELKSDGTIVPHAVNKEDVATISSMSLDEYKQAMPESSMIEDNRGDNRGEIEVEAPTIEGETAAPAEETAAPESAETPATEQTPAAPAITLEDGTIVPMLEDGNPDFSKLTAAQTAELYDNQFGEDANSIVSGYVSDAKKALDKASNMTVKGKTFVEQKAAKDAKEKAIADAQAAYDSAIAIRDAYNERQLAKVEDTAEGRKELIEKARRKFARLKSAVKDDAEAVAQLYKETVGTLLHRLYDGTGIDVTDTIPLTAEEYVASNLGAHSLNYEGTETSKGVKQETGLSREDFAKTQLLAADGKGTTIDNLVHSLWENRPSNLDSLDTQDIRNAMLSVITSGFKASEARNFVENIRIAQAENILEEQKRAQENADYAEQQKAEQEAELKAKSDEKAESEAKSEEELDNESSNESNDLDNESDNEKINDNINDNINVPEDATDENPLGAQRDESDLPFSAKENGTQQTTAERAADVEKNKVDDMKVVDNIVGQKTRKAFERLAKMMGAKIQWQYSDKFGNGWIQETKDADGNVHRTIFITLDSSITEGAQFIFGHEMTHQIKNLNPAAYNELTQLVLDTYGSDAFDKAVDETMQRYSDAGFFGRARDYYAEEVVADAVGEMIRDLNLAHTLAMKMSHPLLAAIHEILQKIKLAFFGTEYSDVTKNIIRSIEQAYVKTANGEVTNSETGEDVSFSLRQKPEPKKKGIGYKVFVLKDGKLYPPMVANPNGAATPVGVWLDADAAPIAGESKTGRPQVKQGGKGTQGGSGKLAYRPGWHLGVVPYAIQFNRKDADGNKTLFPKNFVFAEVEYAADVDYQEEARQEGINPSGKYQHSLAGLKHLPTDGYYMYRTNPNPETDPWVITGAMKVNRILTRAEQADLVSKAGREPQQIQEGDIVTDDVVNSINQEIADAPKFSLKVYHGSGADFTEFDFDHMGEGEGSQAFGWGGYVTNSKEIGKDYTRRAKSRKANHAHFYANMGSLIANDWYEYFVKTANSESLEDAKEFVLKDLDIDIKVDENKLNRNEIPESKRANIVANLKEEKRIREIIANTKKEDLPNIASANLYEVDIPEDNGSNYLDWDAPITDELIDKVTKALPSLRSYDIKDLKKDRTFDNFYKTISMRSAKDDATFNDDKAASQLLASLGYTGIKYKAGRNFGGAEEGDTNYVIFKPEDMRITEHTKFSLRLKSAIEETETNPSDAQKESGNYKKGHIKFGGYDYTIENPKGSTRSGKDADGKEWKVTMHDTYGYIRGKFGKDGDHLDMFINDKADLDNWDGDVFVVDQVNPDGSFDEHKVMYGYDSMDAAKKAYIANYSKGWQGLGNITGVSKDEFDKWLDTSKRKIKPFKDYAKVKFSLKNDGLTPEIANTPVNIVDADEEHGFKNYAEAREWAKKNIVRTYNNEETGGKGEINISNTAVGKYLSEKAVKKSANKDVHMSVLKVLPSILRESVDAIQHVDRNKVGNERSEDFGVNPDVMIHRCYGAVNIGDKVYGVKITLKENVRTHEKTKLYSYEATKIELLDGQSGDVAMTSPRNSNNSITVAKIIKGFETTKKNGEKVDGDGTKFSLKDEEYLKAVEDGNMEKAQKMVNEAAAAAGYSTDSSYQGTSAFNGAAPWGNGYFLTKDERKEAWDNGEFEGESTLGDYINDDIDGGNLEELTNAASYRAADPMRKEAIDNVRNAIQKKAKTITMYRSVPSDVKEGSFRNGDWVTPSRAYAVDNAKLHGWGDDYNIIEQKVPVDDVWFDGNDIAEWGYGREEDYINDTDFAYKNSKNNKKLLDAVTYDDNGNVIPLSQRFNEKNKDVRFSLKDEKTLVGVHNISEEKLLKAIKQGGLANPSVAVIDSSRQDHKAYGGISLILPSDKIAKRTGKNAGTWQGDAYTPTYPEVEKQMSNKGAEKSSSDVLSVPKEMQHEVRNGIDRWLNGGDVNSGLKYLFLHEKGVAPEPKMIQPKFSDEAYNELKFITAGDFNIYGIGKADAQKVLDMYIEAKFDGDKDLYEEKTKAWLERNKSIVDAGAKGGMRYAIAKENVELYDEYGFNYKGVQTFVRDVEYDHRKTGVDTNATLNEVENYIKTNNLTDEFNTWLEGKEKEYGIKEVIFDGFTPSGNRRYVPNTLENVSKLMKKQGRNGATGAAVSFQNFAARLMPSYGTLKDIRFKKGLLTSDREKFDKFRDKWSNVFFELGNKCQPDSTSAFDSYGMERLSEAAMTSAPQAYLKKEYNVDFSDADTKRLKEMVKAIKEEHPAMYFETKFERPVRFDEFSAAVVPTTTKKEVKEVLGNAGVSIFEYDEKSDADRKRAFNEAINSSDNIRFSLAGERGAAAADKAEERTARMDNLSVARKMEEEKKDAKAIKMATGWERGADGKWRYEMPDAKINDTMDVGGGHIVKRYEDDMLWNGGKLSKVIDAPELFKAYPQLKDVRIDTDAIMNDMPSNGEYNSKTNTITIHADDLKYMNGILNHEIQHAIQDIEGFAKGGSPRLVRGEVKKKLNEVTKQIRQLRAEGKEDEAKALIEKNRGLYNAYQKNDDYNSYKSLAGEVEARNVSARMNMTPEERRKTLAESTEDVARKDQIFLGVGDVSFSLRDMADGKESGAADMAEDLKSLNTPDEVDDAIKTALDDMPSGWKMANKKMIHVAQALGENRKAEIAGEEPKFSLKDGTLIKAGTYFSGGGLVEEGLKGIIDPVVAVEYDEKISGVYRNNFGQHIVTADVRDVDPKELVKQIDGEVEYFHASPVCKNYSQAKNNHAEVELDKETAASTAEFINAIKPKVVTIENVKGYKDSDAMKTITDALDANGYTWDADVYNAADYGGYTNRERLIVRAVRDGKLPEKPKKMAHKSGWYEAVADIIPTLTEKKNGVAPWMDVRLKADGIDWRNIDKPLYVMGSAYADGKVPHAFADELLPTLRTKSGDVIVMPDGKVYRAMGRVLARVSGVSDDYKMPFSENLSHTIIGNGIPTQLTEHVIAPLLTGSDSKFSIRAYHGTGVSFDKFDLSHAFEGEGSETFGHGVYVTNSKKIGDNYAQRAKDRKGKFGFDYKIDMSADAGQMLSHYINKNQDVDKGLENARQDLKSALEMFPDDETLKELSAILQKNNNEIAEASNEAYLYDVDIPDDNGENYLGWNESQNFPLEKWYRLWEITHHGFNENEYFKDGGANYDKDRIERIIQMKLDSPENGMQKLPTLKGEELYHALEDFFDRERPLRGAKLASRALSEIGFVGIKYPAGMIHGGAVEGDYNYVIFDEANANIVGNTRFSLRYDKFEHDLNQWKKDNNLPKDAQRPTIPQRNAGESAVDFLKRVDEYRKQMALWKTAPTYEQHLLSDDTALGEFNRELQRGSVLKRIAFQDSMLAIRKAQEAIMKEVGVDRLNMAEDAYTAENRSHGKGKNEFEEYNNEFLQPLRKAYHQMKKVLGDSYDNVRIYMMAKHGLERDAQMAFKKSLDADFENVAQRSAAYRAYKGDMNRITNDSDLEFGRVDFNTWRQRDNALRTKYSPSYMDYRYDKNGIAYDYSGLSALFGGSDFEEAAHKLVRDIESSHVAEVQDLWNATNAATKKILRDGYKAGMMSKDTYQYVRDMYSHYIPLRGWDGTTADQVWDYVGGGKGAFNQTLKTAHGRTSIADDPIAYIENMAESGILLNNKNWVKQHLMLLAQNHPTSLLTLSKAWYVKSTDANGNEEWIPATPQITSQMNNNQVKAAIDAFEQKMEQMAQTGDATQKRDGLNIAYPQTHSEEREHEVRVMKDGEEYVIYVNGDPQLAQAMNNTRAHRVREIQSGKLDRAAAWLGRKMAAAYTSLSPLFIPSNYFRDLTMTLASTAIREDAKYNYLLRKNLATSWNLGFMLKDYQNGKLREKVSNGNATPKEQMFYDFMMNGGETGFVSSLDVEDLKKKFKNDLKDLDRWKANPVKVGHTIMDSIEFLNRMIEDSNRFAVYMTSIQYGRSIDEAVNDAKDVTLNFNRKGTGEYGWQMIRNLYLFINPAVQSLQTLGALAKHHPFKFTAVTASWLVSGVLVPTVNAALMSLFGGDDDKDKYWQFTKWDRRNNLIMWIPYTHEYVKIPLAQEFRAFYGVGDMIASKIMGGELAEESWSQYAEDLLGQVVDMLPLDPTGYDGNIAVSLMPNAIRPVFELAFNVDFTGKPLFKETEYNKYDPNFTKAYVGTPDWLVRASKMVNSIGNDYPDVQQNSIDAFGDPRYNLNNPAVVDHVLSSYLGGAYTMGSQVLGVLTKSLNDPKEIKVADIPLFSKFVSNPDDRPVAKKQGDEFWNMKENHDRAANTLSKLKKQAKVDGNYSMLERFYDSEEYKQYKQDDVKVKKYEEDKKKERAEESGEEYRPHKLNAEDIYKAHATPKDDFEDLKLKQLYTKLNGFKSAYDLLVDTAPSQSDGYYNTNKAAIDAIDEISLDKQEISELKKGFLDDGKDAYNAEDMKQIRELRKRILAVLEKANKVVVANQKAKAEK
jgi:site-specific DNA-cytosine methylase